MTKRYEVADTNGQIGDRLVLRRGGLLFFCL